MLELALAGDDTVEPDVRDVVEGGLDDNLPACDMPDDDGPLLRTMTNAADFFGVSPVTIWRMVKEGTLRTVQIRPRVFRIRRADLDEISANYAFSYSPTP